MKVNIKKLNEDIAKFPQVTPITKDMTKTFEGVSRLIMLDRYSFKDTQHDTLKVGDLVVLTINPDPNFPARGIGYITGYKPSEDLVTVELEEQYANQVGEQFLTVKRQVLDKPLELYYEQIARRNARGLSEVEAEDVRQQWEDEFYEELVSTNFVPAGRVIYGAGSGADVTYFNCYVMPHPKDSREGIGEHRNEVMEIMSRGGGVGTNGSTLRPRNALARGVNGKSSGAVSWLDDIAKLTHLVEQGGSRRGAQMIMLADWHPDILEFIISKMQNPKILRFIIETTEDEEIRSLAKQKLKFKALDAVERGALELAEGMYGTMEEFDMETTGEEDASAEFATKLLEDGGRYSVHNPDFLSGANISVALTHEFMQAVDNDKEYALRFPDVENYTPEQMAEYNDKWHEIGDVREWHLPVKTYRTIKAKELWQLVNICATYAAEPGVFFIDNANDETNAQAYGQKVVCTNPCGEQPLAPYSVCNLAAVNLAEMVDKDKREVDFEKLKRTVRRGVRMQDNVIDSTPYFLEANRVQALGERRVGMGVMALADMLIYCGVEYGSPESLELIDKVFETISHEAYRASIDLAKEKGSFPFLTGQGADLKRNAFINSGYMRRMPKDIRQDILTFGIRNSHLLTVAPTGSTGSMIGVSTGLEPYFSFKYFRSGRLGKFMEVNAAIVEELGADPTNLPAEFVSSMDLSPEAHVDVQNTIQRHIDSSISKTVNAPKGYSVEQVQAVYERLYSGGAKGGTVYVDGSRDTQVLTLTADDSKPAETTKEHPVYEAPVKPLADTVTFGTEIGNTCPVCRQGEVIDSGGCSTCSNCQAQLRCGL